MKATTATCTPMRQCLRRAAPSSRSHAPIPLDGTVSTPPAVASPPTPVPGGTSCSQDRHFKRGRGAWPLQRGGATTDPPRPARPQIVLPGEGLDHAAIGLAPENRSTPFVTLTLIQDPRGAPLLELDPPGIDGLVATLAGPISVGPAQFQLRTPVQARVGGGN